MTLTGLGWLALAQAAQAQGLATNLTLQLSQPSVPVGGTSITALVTATNMGLPVPGEVIDVSSSPAGPTITPATDNGDGTYTVTITSSSGAGPFTITANDAAANAGAGISSLPQTLTQTPGPATHISLSVSPPTIPANGSSTATATATVTDAFSNPVSADNVVISSANPTSPTVPQGNGNYMATIRSTTTAGNVTVRATDKTTGIRATPQTLTQVAGPAAHISLTVTPGAILADGLSTSTATATVTDAVGNPVNDAVTFSSSNPGDTIFGQTNPAPGVVHASIRSSITPGLSTITATDSAAGIIAQQSLNEVAGSSATSLVISPSSPVSTNQVVTLFAAVSSSSGPPHGAIEFLNGFVPIPGCTNLGLVATCQTSFAASSLPLQISAVFTADSTSAVAGSSSTVPLTVQRGPTSTSLGVSSPTAIVGSRETYTAFVAPSNQGPIGPTGSVNFSKRGHPLPGCGNVPLKASGAEWTASCTVTYQTSGTRQVTAVYSGDQNFSGSSSSGLNVPVGTLGAIRSPMQWQFIYHPSFTTIAMLVVNGVSLGTKVTVICHGHGCPYTKQTTALHHGFRCTPTGRHKCGSHARAPIALTGAFHRHRLVVGTRITIEIRRPGWVGEFFSFLMRPGRGPQIRISCLGPGQTKPGVGC